MRAARAYETMEVEAPRAAPIERFDFRSRALLVVVPIALAGVYMTILLLV